MSAAKSGEADAGDSWDAPLLEELCQTMVDASICGLGQAAPNPILLTLKHFGHEVGSSDEPEPPHFGYGTVKQ